MQEGVGGIKPTEETYVREDSLNRRLYHTSLVARYARKELDGDYNEKDCCVKQRGWLATLVGTKRGL